MKQIVFIGLMLLVGMNVSGQVRNVDSLKYVLNTPETAPAEKMQLCMHILNYYMHHDLDSTLVYAGKGERLAEKEHDDLWIARFSRMMGYYYMKTGESDLCLQALEKALVYAGKANNDDEKVMIHLYIGSMYRESGKYKEAIQSHMDILPILEKTQPREYATTLVNIANLYRAMHNDEKALEYGKRAVAAANGSNAIQAQMGVYALLGNIYYDKKQFDSTVYYMHKVYDLGRKHNNMGRVIVSTQTLAVAYSDLKDHVNAERYAKECLETAEQFGEKQLILMAWAVMAKVNFDTKRYKECEEYAVKIWEADSTNAERTENATFYACKANIFLNNPQKASLFFDRYVKTRDQLNDKNLYDSLSDAEVKYETEKKEMRIAALEKERQLYIRLGVAGALLAVALGIMLWQRIKNARKEKQLISTRSVLEGEMGERARLSRDLHDRLSGYLSAIKIELNENKESMRHISGKLDNCIEEIRRVSHDLMPVSLQFGMKVALEDFAAQFPNVHFHFFGEEKRIDERTEFIVYCCAGELVNNAQRHSGAENINLQLVQDGKYVSLTVQDDGCGFDVKSVTKGIGLKNIRDRVASCNGRIDISTSPGNGTETIIELKTD